MTPPQQESGVAANLGRLPALVRRYAERVLPDAGDEGRVARVAQVGEVMLKPGARPRRFTACEELAIERVGFAWRARFPMPGPILMSVTDSYDEGVGLLEVRVLGVPLQRKRGPQLARGEAFRYLAEIPWVPHAIRANSNLEWRELDQRTAEVAARVDDARIAVRLMFTDVGEVTQTIAQRPRVDAGDTITSWICTYQDHESLASVRVPTHDDVRWELPAGPFTYWRATITSLEPCP